MSDRAFKDKKDSLQTGLEDLLESAHAERPWNTPDSSGKAGAYRLSSLFPSLPSDYSDTLRDALQRWGDVKRTLEEEDSSCRLHSELQLERLNAQMRRLTKKVLLKKDFQDLTLLCQVSRQAWEHLLTRRLIFGVAPDQRLFFGRLLRSFIDSVTSVGAVRVEVCALAGHNSGIAEDYFDSMELRKLLAEYLLWGATDILTELGKLLDLPASSANSVGVSLLEKNDLEAAILDATCAWLLAHKLKSLSFEMERERGPWLPAMKEHENIGAGAAALLHLARRHLALPPNGAFLKQWRDEFLQWMKKVDASIEELKSARAEFDNRQATREDIAPWLAEYRVALAGLGLEASKHFQHLQARLPDSAWESWMALEGTVDTRYMPPENSADRPKAFQEALAVLDDLHLETVCAWLGLIERRVPELKETDGAALRLATRAMDHHFPAGSRWLGAFVTAGEGCCDSPGYFQIAAAGAIAAFFHQCACTSCEVEWLFKIIGQVHDTPGKTYFNSTRHAVAAASLFTAALVVSGRGAESRAKLETLRNGALNAFSQVADRRTWIMTVVSQLGTLHTADSFGALDKLVILRPFLQGQSITIGGAPWIIDELKAIQNKPTSGEVGAPLPVPT